MFQTIEAIRDEAFLQESETQFQVQVIDDDGELTTVTVEKDSPNEVKALLDYWALLKLLKQ